MRFQFDSLELHRKFTGEDVKSLLHLQRDERALVERQFWVIDEWVQQVLLL